MGGDKHIEQAAQALGNALARWDQVLRETAAAAEPVLVRCATDQRSMAEKLARELRLFSRWPRFVELSRRMCP